jgi:hypothetical protein
VLFAGLEAAFAPDANDADLRQTCRTQYALCMSQPPGVTECSNATATPNCRATVSELAACLVDTSGVVRELARLMPDCGALTVAG